MSTSGSAPRGLSALRRLAAPAPASDRAREPEVCEMCSLPISAEHGHVADTHDHRLLCVCRPCSLLFDPSGSGGHRYRGLPTRVLRVDDLRLGEEQWEALQIPVELAFLFHQDGRYLAFYPGPSGATESLLDLDAWSRVLADNPALAAMTEETEAVLLRHLDPGFTCYVVPVDVCYALVGLVRTHWNGMSGGADVWRHLDAFFADLERRSTSSSAAAGSP